MEKPIVFLLLQLAFAIWLVRFYKHRSGLSTSRMAFYCSLFFYLSILALVIMTNITLQSELDSFDLNQDGIFSGSEITPAQNEALNKVCADTGRTFAPMVGILYSLIYFWMVYFVLKVIRKKPSGI